MKTLITVLMLVTVAFAQSNVTKDSSASAIPKQEQIALAQVDALQIELIQTKIESLNKDLQLLASRLCNDAKFTRESCRVNIAAGFLTGVKIELAKEAAKVEVKK